MYISPHSLLYPLCLVIAPVLSAASTTATSISLSWTSAGSVVDSYEVMWQRDTSGECSDEDEGSTNITDGSTSYDIMGLEEDSSYNVSVMAINSIGSANSNTVTGITMEAGKQLTQKMFTMILLGIILYIYIYIAPFASPTSVGTLPDTSSSITVQWGAVDCIHRNGDITGYSVRYGVQGSGSTQNTSVSVNEATLSGLTPSTTYSIDVAAVNGAGTGVYSDPMDQLTLGMWTVYIASAALTCHVTPSAPS